MIHCVGDSHSSVFSGKEEMQPVWPYRSDDRLENFKSYRIGPATAFNLFKKIPTINEILASQVDQEKDWIVFCFGEVDIRAHLIKQMEIQQKDSQELVDECAARYFEVIKYFKDSGYKIAIWAPIASWSQEKPYMGPSFGSNFERNLITQIFTLALTDLCTPIGVPVLSIFNKMVYPNFNTNPEWVDDWDECHIHLSQRALPLVLEEFKEKGLL